MLKILLRAIRAPAVNNRAMLRTAVTIWWAPPVLIFNQDSTISASAVVAMLGPGARGRWMSENPGDLPARRSSSQLPPTRAVLFRNSAVAEDSDRIRATPVLSTGELRGC